MIYMYMYIVILYGEKRAWRQATYSFLIACKKYLRQQMYHGIKKVHVNIAVELVELYVRYGIREK